MYVPPINYYYASFRYLHPFLIRSSFTTDYNGTVCWLCTYIRFDQIYYREGETEEGSLDYLHPITPIIL
jgi:hypothetical protein